MSAIRRVAVVLGVISMLMAGGAAGAAQAAPTEGETITAAPAAAIPASQAIDEFGVTAWSDCPSGDFCIWSGTNASGSRCSWSNADSDWYSGTIQCSWADTQPVRSAYNHGTSSSYWGVWVYIDANYQWLWSCLPQGYVWTDVTFGGQSHRWMTSAC